MTRPRQAAPSRRHGAWPARTTRVILLALAGPIILTAEAGSIEPAVNYALHCQGCHLADGRSTAGLVPPLDDAVAGLASRPLGRDYLVRLPNVASAPISDEDLAALLNWLVGRFGAPSRPPNAPFTAAEVAPRRSRPLLDSAGARRDAMVEAGR